MVTHLVLKSALNNGNEAVRNKLFWLGKEVPTASSWEQGKKNFGFYWLWTSWATTGFSKAILFPKASGLISRAWKM
jgi:hypothetical protein